jgi:hypothetical protein
MIKTMERSHRITSLLFSICFFIYAVSPLSAIYQQKQVIEQTASAFNGIRLLVIELLLSPLAQDDDSDDAFSRVLLRKKRATLSSDKLKTSKKQIKNSIVASSDVLSSEKPRVWLVAQNEKTKPQNRYHLTHSGLSPPSV